MDGRDREMSIKMTTITDICEVTSWADGDFEIELDVGYTCLRVYLNEDEVANLVDALVEHQNREST